MASIVLGCDKNGVNDAQYQDTVRKALEKAGHKVEKLPISAGPFGSYGYKNKAKGKIGVYLMASSLVSVTDVPSSGWKFKYTYFGIRKIPGLMIQNMNDFNKKGIPKDHHGDCTNSYCDKWQGKTYPQINEIIKNKGKVIFSPTAQQMGEDLAKLIGGGSLDSDSAKKISQGGTIRDALQKLLTYWDGEVECYIRGNEVHVNRIRDPEKYASTILQEGYNVFSDSVTVTDVNPNTVNYLEVIWSGGTIVIKDDKLIERFGINKSTVLAANVNSTEIKKSSKKTDS